MAGAKGGLDLTKSKAHAREKGLAVKKETAEKKSALPLPKAVGEVSSPSDLMKPQETPTAESGSEDDEILAAISSKPKKNNMLFIVCGIGVVCLLVIGFLIARGGNQGSNNTSQNIVQTPTVQQQPTQSQVSTDTGTAQSGTSTGVPSGMGAQDFTSNTNMTNSDVLMNPDKYVQDIYGLTTRVDYTVSSISYIADFVSYTKHRGTWGGGLELYWLDVKYQGVNYVVQIPFVYYKELTAEGIVPVKMEVLSIAGTKEGETFTVISYMCLDEPTLKAVLKNQKGE